MVVDDFVPVSGIAPIHVFVQVEVGETIPIRRIFPDDYRDQEVSSRYKGDRGNGGIKSFLSRSVVITSSPKM